MSMEAVICCAGKSLLATNYRSLGLPICAVSSAIRVICQPDYWMFCDAMHLCEGARKALADDRISKLALSRVEKIHRDNGVIAKNICYCIPPDKWGKYSLPFAIWGMTELGFDKLFLVGVDVSGDYAYLSETPSELAAKLAKSSFRTAHRLIRQHRLNVVSMTPGSPINAHLKYEGPGGEPGPSVRLP